MRQRVRHQCCTRGRSRPAHPRPLAGVLMRDEPARRFVCARCRAPVLVCSHCDRGQIYCATGCAATARHQRQRDAAQRYQGSLRGRFKHAARTQRWRQRQAVLAISTSMPAATSAAPSAVQAVTHQGCPPAASDAVLAAVPSSTPAAAAAASVQPCMTITISRLSMPALPAAADPAVTPAVWRCLWCQTPCATRVRLGFLRHTRPPRIAGRKECRSHGHSP